MTDKGGKAPDMSDVKVEVQDFEMALTEVPPAFGQHEDELDALCVGGVLEFSPQVTRTMEALRTLAGQLKASPTTSVLSVLLDGSPGSGKSSLAGAIARASEFPFIRVISPDKYVGQGELSKVTAMNKAFEDAS